MRPSASTARTLRDLLLSATTTYDVDVALQIRRGLRYERISYASAAETARRLGSWFCARGLEPGERVAVQAPNMPEYVLLYFGAWLAGLVVVPIDVRTRSDVVARVVADSDARLIFGSSWAEDDGLAIERHALEQLRALVSGCAPLAELPPLEPDAAAVIAYTSGTTGVPKGVVLTHANLLAECAALAHAYPLRTGLAALSILPLSHIYELTVTFLHGFASGARVTYLRRVNGATIARAMVETRTDATVVVPDLLRLMLRAIEHRQGRGRVLAWRALHRVAPRLPFAARRVLFAPVRRALGGRIDLIGVGGAALDISVARAWEHMGIHVREGYGMTETAGGVTVNGPLGHRLGTVGRPLPSVEVRIAQDGEIEVRGPTVMVGYHRDPERTAEAFRDGWLRTGDVGRIDDHGFLRVTGRTAFRIVLPTGVKVYPEDVERELNAEPVVRDSCVIGVRDESGRERVHAALLLLDPERADEAVRNANRRLSDHQRVRTWTIWPARDFPRGPTLKPDHRAIRAIVERGAPHDERATPPDASDDPLALAIGRARGRPVAALRAQDALESDLGVDSMGRVELLSILEEDAGVAIDDLRVGPETTVAELRTLMREAEHGARVVHDARWPRSAPARSVGDVLVWIASRIQDRWVRLEVVHPERARTIPTPSLLVFNYQAPFTPLLVLRTLPRSLRHRVAAAVTAEAWSGLLGWHGRLAALAVQGFPLVKKGGTARASMERAARLVDDGYSVLISPEGTPSMCEAPGPFLPGVGMLAVELGVPIVPFRVDGYSRLYPPHDVPFPWLPYRSGRVRIVVGEPVRVPPGATFEEAADLAKRAIFSL